MSARYKTEVNCSPLSLLILRQSFAMISLSLSLLSRSRHEASRKDIKLKIQKDS